MNITATQSSPPLSRWQRVLHWLGKRREHRCRHLRLDGPILGCATVISHCRLCGPYYGHETVTFDGPLGIPEVTYRSRP